MLSLNLFAQRARGSESSVVPDSVLAVTSSIAADSSLVASSDSIPNDSVSKKRDELEAPVVYQSQASMVWYKNGNAYLYGDGQVNYQKIELKANEITIDLDNTTV